MRVAEIVEDSGKITAGSAVFSHMSLRDGWKQSVTHKQRQRADSVVLGVLLCWFALCWWVCSWWQVKSGWFSLVLEMYQDCSWSKETFLGREEP